MSAAHFADALALTALSVALPGTLYLAVLTLAGILPRRVLSEARFAGRLALVVPAHDEESGIGETVANLAAEAARDRETELVVIADNCTDATAQRAAAAGARVIVRDEPCRRGKGYALHHAFTTLWSEDHAAFVVVDADSRVAPGFLEALRRRLGAGARAVQARYTVLNPEDTPRTRLSEIALAAWNVLRPRGRDRLGISVGLLGNGFALRREVLEAVPYTADSVVEDLEYHLALVDAGVRVDFVDDATVMGEMPTAAAAATSQRARWEGGRLLMLRRHAPRLAGLVLRGKLRFLEPLADLLLLPLAYQVAVILLGMASALAVGNSAATGLAAIMLAVVTTHVVAALPVAGLPWRRLLTLALVPWYLVWKLTRLGAVLRGACRESTWVRTARNPTSNGAPS